MEFNTFVELLCYRAEKHPNLNAFTFFKDGETEEASLTYRQLDKKAKEIAVHLTEKGLTGKRAILIYPPGLEFITAFTGCLYAGVIPVPAYPPELNRMEHTLKRLQAVMKDAATDTILTTGEILFYAQSALSKANIFSGLKLIATDLLVPAEKINWSYPDINNETIALLQYTSGSTGNPKGVVISHNNLLSNEKMIMEAFEHDENKAKLVCWVPFYHDMGLIGHLLQSLYSGGQTLIMSPVAFLQKPFRWLNLISRYKGTSTGAPNFAYDLCVRKISPEQRDSLDLSSLTLALNGAEPVNASTIRKFTEYFAPCGFKSSSFLPSYGMAEATVFISCGLRSKRPAFLTIDKDKLEKNLVEVIPENSGNAVTLVGSGQSWGDEEIRIVNPETLQECKRDEVGEIWLSGSHIARGYWKNREETEKNFEAYLKGSGEGPYLRTGDLGFIHDDELFVNGRLKDMIIIRGRNIYPHDVERLVETLREKHEEIRPGCCSVFSVEMEGEEKLVIFQELSEPDAFQAEKIIETIITEVSREFEIPVYSTVLLEKGTLPKTSSGKIMRRASKKAFLSGLKNSGIKVIATQTAGEKKEKSKTGEIQQLIISLLSQETGINPEEIDTGKPFSFYGIDSAVSVALVKELEDRLGVKLYETIFWDYQNIRLLSDYLSGLKTEKKAELPVLQNKPDKVAIVGISCRFPGKADSAEKFWKLLENKGDAVTEVPASRWDSSYNGKMSSNKGGFIENPEFFEPEFFNISPREALSTDPQQRLLLEVTYQALEDAGINIEQVRGTDTGVFVGISSNDYSRFSLNSGDPGNIDNYCGIGNAFSVAAGRLAYFFDFHGPVSAIDTACSSSLAAVHHAAASLLNGECNMAVAGGVNLILSPELTIYFSKINALSPEGKCKTFDEKADGYVRSEGCGMVVLKKLSDAVRDNDRVYGLILASELNHDGSSNGLTAPNGMAQRQLISRAVSRAGLKPEDISYLEAHGTGTPLGDPIEIRAVSESLCQGRSLSNPLFIGAVKSNMGHLEAAAGVAGLIKVLMAFKYKKIPANINFSTINPRIAEIEGSFVFPTETTDWKPKGKRIAGISSFGISGTNAHILLQEFSQEEGDYKPGPPYLLTLSARSAEALQNKAGETARFLTESNPSLYDFCYTSAIRRVHCDKRFFTVFNTKAELIENLENYLPAKVSRNKSKKVVFVFPGQGSQWAGMGKQLFETEKVFRDMVNRCDAEIRKYTGFSAAKIIREGVSEPEETEIIQPLLFTIQAALAELWKYYGVSPSAVIGHSMGELAAFYTAGVLSLEEAVKIICIRSENLKKAGGSMLLTSLSAEEAEKLILPYNGKLSVAVKNGPENTVLAGESDLIELVHSKLENENIFSRKIKVKVASHSPQVDKILPEIKEKLGSITGKNTEIKIFSTVTGKQLKGEEATGEYWLKNLRETVLFQNAIDIALSENFHIFVEISPHPILLPSIRECTGDTETVTIASMKKETPEKEFFLKGLGEMYNNGAEIYLPRLFPFTGRVVSMPPYIWNKTRYWPEVKPVAAENTVLEKIQEQPAANYLNVPAAELYQLVFRPEELQETEKQEQAGQWLIFTAESGIGDDLKMLMESRGKTCIVIHEGESLEVINDQEYKINPESPAELDFVLKTLKGQPLKTEGIIYLWPMKLPFKDALTDELLNLSRSYCFSVPANLLRSLDRYKLKIKLIISTRGIYSVVAEDNITDILQSPVQGFARTISHEYPALTCKTVDLSFKPHFEEIMQLFDEALSDNPENFIAFRKDKRYLGRLAEYQKKENKGAIRKKTFFGRVKTIFSDDNPAEKPEIKNDKTYLVTGGYGGLGLEVVRFLCEKGAGNIIIAGRKGPSEEVKKAISSFSNNTAITYYNLDIGDEKEVSALFRETGEKLPELKGIIHAAGVLDDGIIAMQAQEKFDTVARAKIKGSWNLHKNTAGKKLDFFCMFSSAASIIGSAGQSSYAAVNSFMDALAIYRNQSGLPAMSINWGPWSESGLAHQQSDSERFANSGIGYIQPKEGIKIFEKLLSDNPLQVAVLALDIRTFFKNYPAAKNIAILHELAEKNGITVKKERQPEIMVKVAENTGAEKITISNVNLEETITGFVSEILKLPAHKIDKDKNLREYGFDSLMALELKGRIEQKFRINLPVTAIGENLSISALAGFLRGDNT